MQATLDRALQNIGVGNLLCLISFKLNTAIHFVLGYVFCSRVRAEKVVSGGCKLQLAENTDSWNRKVASAVSKASMQTPLGWPLIEHIARHMKAAGTRLLARRVTRFGVWTSLLAHGSFSSAPAEVGDTQSMSVFIKGYASKVGRALSLYLAVCLCARLRNQ